MVTQLGDQRGLAQDDLPHPGGIPTRSWRTDHYTIDQHVLLIPAEAAPRAYQLQAALYDPPGVGGTTVITVLAHGDHPEWYGLPKDPKVPGAVRFWKNILRPLAAVTIAASFFAMVGHYLSFGPKKPKDETPTPGGMGTGGGGA